MLLIFRQIFSVYYQLHLGVPKCPRGPGPMGLLRLYLRQDYDAMFRIQYVTWVLKWRSKVTNIFKGSFQTKSKWGRKKVQHKLSHCSSIFNLF